ncbi:hypothetical protein [Xanthomonas tesorieronis]
MPLQHRGNAVLPKRTAVLGKEAAVLARDSARLSPAVAAAAAAGP